MRILLRTFAFLDLLSLVFMTMQLWAIINNYSAITLLSDKIQGILMFPMYVLVLVGAYGLFFQKKIGFISYYIQFPFRLYLWVFTVGFFSLLLEAFTDYNDDWLPILLKICFAVEFVRLCLTVRAHQVTKA